MCNREADNPDSIHSAAEQPLTALRFPFRLHDSFGDPHPSRSITISSTLSFRPLLLLQDVSGNRCRRVCACVTPFSYPYDVIPYFQPYDIAPSFTPTVSLSFTHTGLHHSDLWRRFNWQAETSCPASTPPEDIRPFPWAVTFTHTCYNRLPFRLETGKNLHIWSLLPNLHPSLEHNCLVLPSNCLKDTVPPSSQPLQQFPDDTSNHLGPIPVPSLAKP
nr:hypothetical protein HmN_000773900 [Hymenolepis microstoma]